MSNDFEFTQPIDICEALKCLNETGRITPIAGGTNILVNMKRAPIETDLIIDLTRLEKLKNISEENGMFRIGAGVSFADLLNWHPGGAVEGLVRPMCAAFAGPLIRNLATIGGNICDASAAADASPVLLALDANVELVSTTNGSRTLPLSEFFKGVRKTAREDNELLTYVTFGKPAEGERCFYYKLGKRKADAISIVSIAILAKLNEGKIEKVHIALGAVAPIAMRALQTEAMLIGKVLNTSSIQEAATLVVKEACPIDDFRATAKYRLNMIEVLVKKGLNEILSKA
ncbi:MAG: FAD-binding protein [Gammaproteobacteria bacterium]|nr:FAD-binding protein [Gammaproteobacteria bacterium]